MKRALPDSGLKRRPSPMRTMNRCYDTRECLCTFSDPILIRCPRCANPGGLFLTRKERESRRWQSIRRFACMKCAHSYEWKPRGIVHSVRDWNSRLPLLLQTECCGEVLWAFNERHLDFLYSYASSLLRERIGHHNASLASRLPQWIKSRKNRTAVLRGVSRLRKLLDGGLLTSPPTPASPLR
jgi:hypothetical protein